MGNFIPPEREVIPVSPESYTPAEGRLTPGRTGSPQPPKTILENRHPDECPQTLVPAPPPHYAANLPSAFSFWTGQWLGFRMTTEAFGNSFPGRQPFRASSLISSRLGPPSWNYPRESTTHDLSRCPPYTRGIRQDHRQFPLRGGTQSMVGHHTGAMFQQKVENPLGPCSQLDRLHPERYRIP